MADDLLSQMIAASGLSPEEYAAQQAEGRFVPGKEVKRGPEFRRIRDLPRRDWEARDQSHVEAYFMQHLRAPGGTQKLRPVQIAALWEMHGKGGLLAQARTGSGKTLISLLGFIVLNAQRPMLIVPAALKEKTVRDMAAYRKNWLVPPHIFIKSYEIIGRSQSANLISDYNPDVIITDESQRLKNPAAASTRRIKDYIEAHPEVKFVAMSGTIAKRSIKDYAHIAKWCLREGSPVPNEFHALMEWSAALDDPEGLNKSNGFEGAQPVEPGALLELCSPEELAEPDRLRGVRKAYRRRLTDTPGVIATQEDALGVSLRIDPLIVKDPIITKVAAYMKEKWERPDGVELIDATEIWRHLRTVGRGFFYRWNPAPPDEWRNARRAWAANVRDILRTNRSGIYSEKMVADAIDAGQYPSDILRTWRDIQPIFDPEANKEAVWLTTSVLDACATWAKTNTGIIWVKDVEFGQVLAQRTGLAYYANKGIDAKTKRFIEDHPHKTPMIASIDSNSAGLNLQYGWHTNLIVAPPTTGMQSEQLISRTHREGQPEDEVVVIILASIPEAFADFDRACQDARRATDMEGQEQRLCYADITIPPEEERANLWI